MARTTIGQRAVRVLVFLMGLRNEDVARMLRASGMTAEDVDDGWARLQALTRGRLDFVAAPTEPDPKLLMLLDTWENRWFPVVSATLRARFPAAYAKVFNNLTQAEGIEVMISVRTLLTRFGELTAAEQRDEVRALLEKRGFTPQVIAEGNELVASLSTFASPREAPSNIDAVEEAARETALWDWYLEWSSIARAAIRDRRALRALGFLVDRGGVLVEPNDDTEVDPTVAPTPPRPGNGGGTPRVEPGMPGSDPFDVNP